MRACLLILLPWPGSFAFQSSSPHVIRRTDNSDVIKSNVFQSLTYQHSPPSPTSLNAFNFPLFRSESPSRSSDQVDNKRQSLRRRFHRWVKRTVLAAAFFFMINISSAGPAWARSGGRMGGSFKRTPTMRSMPRSYSRPSAPVRSYPYRSQPRLIMHRGPHVHVHTSPREGASILSQQQYAAPVARRVTLSDVILVAGVGSLVAIKVNENYRENGSPGNDVTSALGPGISVLSITAAVNVPDRDSPNSVLARLSRLALTARTDTRKGVQDLIVESSLELLRQEQSIVSVDSQYEYFKRVTDAEREFNGLSIGGRSKFDKETVNNFGGNKKSTVSSSSLDNLPRATVAVVTINLCIEGDSTRISKIRNRAELRSSLSRIASDSQVDDCLLSAEVLWTPEVRTEKITYEDLYADYPSLYPLID